MIEISNITRIYGAQTAVDNVSLTIEAGDVAVIVGTSGSGKTTLMRMINRLVEPSHGVIKIDGKDNRELPRIFCGAVSAMQFRAMDCFRTAPLLKISGPSPPCLAGIRPEFPPVLMNC